MSEDKKSTSQVSITAPWPVIAALIFGIGGVAGGGSYALPKFLGEQSPEQAGQAIGAAINELSDHVDVLASRVDSLSVRVSALAHTNGRLSSQLSDIDGDFGKINSITHRLQRIAKHIATMDDRIDSLEERRD